LLVRDCKEEAAGNKGDQMQPFKKPAKFKSDPLCKYTDKYNCNTKPFTVFFIDLMNRQKYLLSKYRPKQYLLLPPTTSWTSKVKLP